MSIMVLGHGSDRPGDRLNSRESIARVLRSGAADGIEVDIRRTADDVLVACHDPLFADGRVVNQTRADDVPGDVPTLVEVLDMCKGSLVNIEIKNYRGDPGFDEDERITDLAAGLVESRSCDRVMVSSFGMDCVDRFAKLLPKVPTAFLLYYPGEPDQVLDEIAEHDHKLVHPFEPLVDASFLQSARARHLEVNVWFGREDPARTAELVTLGIDGLITADPVSTRTIEQQVERDSGIRDLGGSPCAP